MRERGVGGDERERGGEGKIRRLESVKLIKKIFINSEKYAKKYLQWHSNELSKPPPSLLPPQPAPQKGEITHHHPPIRTFYF